MALGAEKPALMAFKKCTFGGRNSFRLEHLGKSSDLHTSSPWAGGIYGGVGGRKRREKNRNLTLAH